MLWLSSQPYFAAWIHRFPLARILKMALLKEGIPALNLPWQMIFYLSTGVLAGIVVSLITKPISSARLDQYYRLIKTPVIPGEPPVEQPCTLPAGIQTKTRKELFPGRSIYLPIPSRTSVQGFIGMGMLIALLILGVGWIVAR